jgi:hypothetical protein
LEIRVYEGRRWNKKHLRMDGVVFLVVGEWVLNANRGWK